MRRSHPDDVKPARGATPSSRGRAPAMAALVLVTGIGPWAVDTYVAALPQLQRSLHTTAAVAQLTLTAFIIGVALGQLVLGPLSDARGRQSLLYGGTAAFTVTSVCCALAPTGPLLVAARLGQGIAAGCGVAVGRAVVGDVYRGAEAAKRYGTMAGIIFLGPVIAPALGGVVLTVGSWRTIFGGLALVGLVMMLAVRLGIPETLPRGSRHGQGLRSTAVRMLDLLGDWSFMRHVTVQCLTTAGFFTYIGGSSFVLQTVYGMSPSEYAALFATNAATMAASSGVFRLTVARVGASRLRGVGLLLAGGVIVRVGDAGHHGAPRAAATASRVGTARDDDRRHGAGAAGHHGACPGGRAAVPRDSLRAPGWAVVPRRCPRHTAHWFRRL